jgi:hypothetical protein
MSDTNERSVASTGSVANEPAAWGVLRVGGGWVSILANEVQAETSRKSWDANENWVHEVIPLYRLPMLTGEEQEALKQAEWTLREIVDANCDKAAATLRCLLDRLG